MQKLVAVSGLFRLGARDAQDQASFVGFEVFDADAWQARAPELPDALSADRDLAPLR